jgi:hypothetical protein
MSGLGVQLQLHLCHRFELRGQPSMRFGPHFVELDDLCVNPIERILQGFHEFANRLFAALEISFCSLLEALQRGSCEGEEGFVVALERFGRKGLERIRKLRLGGCNRSKLFG